MPLDLLRRSFLSLHQLSAFVSKRLSSGAFISPRAGAPSRAALPTPILPLCAWTSWPAARTVVARSAGADGEIASRAGRWPHCSNNPRREFPSPARRAPSRRCGASCRRATAAALAATGVRVVPGPTNPGEDEAVEHDRPTPRACRRGRRRCTRSTPSSAAGRPAALSSSPSRAGSRQCRRHRPGRRGCRRDRLRRRRAVADPFGWKRLRFYVIVLRMPTCRRRRPPRRRPSAPTPGMPFLLPGRRSPSRRSTAPPIAGGGLVGSEGAGLPEHCCICPTAASASMAEPVESLNFAGRRGAQYDARRQRALPAIAATSVITTSRRLYLFDA